MSCRSTCNHHMVTKETARGSIHYMAWPRMASHGTAFNESRVGPAGFMDYILSWSMKPDRYTVKSL